MAGLPHSDSLLSGFCSSGPSFAPGFLQIPPRDGHPCLLLTVPVTTARRGLAPPGYRTCLAHKPNGASSTLAPFSFIPVNPTVIRKRDHGSLFIVQDHFLQLELPSVLLAERQACLAGDRVGVEFGEHMVGGGVEVPGEGGWHGISARLNSFR
jgi:hypothetical protein